MMKPRMALVLSTALISLVACAVTYPFKYFYLWPGDTIDATILAGKAEDGSEDESLRACWKNKGDCVVYKNEVHKQVVKKMLDLYQENESLKRHCPKGQ